MKKRRCDVLFLVACLLMDTFVVTRIDDLMKEEAGDRSILRGRHMQDVTTLLSFR